MSDLYMYTVQEVLDAAKKAGFKDGVYTIQHYTEQLKKSYDKEWLDSEAENDVRSFVAEYGLAEARKFIEKGELPVGAVLLGNCLNMYPSGKYYTPFANSDVTEDEALLDALYTEALESWAWVNGGYIMRGEEDPLDVFFVPENVEALLDMIEKELSDEM